MGRTSWRCRNPGCGVPERAVLGTVTRTGDLELADDIAHFVVHLDIGRATVRCPACGTAREFRGGTIFSFRPRS